MKIFSKDYFLETFADSLTFGASFLIVFMVAGIVEVVMKQLLIPFFAWVYPGFVESSIVEMAEWFKVLVFGIELFLLLSFLVKLILRTACSTYKFDFCERVNTKGI